MVPCLLSDKIPRVSSYSGSCSLRLALSPTGLSPSLAVLHQFALFRFRLSQLLQPHISMVWAFPLSLAATRGITFVFFSSGTWMFRFPVLPFRMHPVSDAGFPHSDRRVFASFTARAAFRVRWSSLQLRDGKASPYAPCLLDPACVLFFFFSDVCFRDFFLFMNCSFVVQCHLFPQFTLDLFCCVFFSFFRFLKESTPQDDPWKLDRAFFLTSPLFLLRFP